MNIKGQSAVIGLSMLVIAAATPASAQTYRFEKRDDRGNVEGKRAGCEVYARIAQVQTDANIRFRCGYNGPRWTREANQHFRWCRFAPRARTGEELRERAVDLQRCFDRLGDFDDNR